ncbi:outer membrane protein assembly factor [Providencia stuartii]|uniref:Translocation and assembly module subunit TamA n=2 Tax=Providencia TaxID=586 RepID=A0A1S1HSL3_PROST|nr:MULTISPECIES: autotransporter assembly complex family protein [Providencia]MDV5226299.1 autotransporter assembly complex family protein [Providencia rettgeri]ELR5039019.1 outer membrane protein assembly factor [Providencia stuartii]ELR5082783.1 outer membrane protein assembly factor [Providencia stuartii]ELR5299372.1 outer membrane protein assembly factor [Providencia stuartii]MDW7588446.1 autotransporter assembly complex family protein [Providencia sp. 2023EL-00965]
MSKYPIICFLCLTAAVPVAYGANLRLNIEGLEGQTNQNVRVQLSNISQDEVAPNGRFRARVTKAIEEGLRPLGYYEPKIEFSYQENKPPARSILTAKVTLGEPVTVQGVKVILEGGAKTDPNYAKMIKNNTPKIGTIQNDGEYESFKGKFSSLAIREGYFDAVMEKSQLGISLDHHASYWDFDFNSGERYRFGAISYEGSQIRSDYLNNLAPFKEGEYYTSEQLAEFNRRLAETGWFTSSIVTPNIAKARENHTDILPMEGVMVPRAKNFVELGGGYATDVGPRVKATWNRPWVNSRGQSITSNISLSQPEQIIDASYKIPLKANPLEQYYAVQGGYKRTDLNDTESDTTTLNVSRNWDYSSGWQYGVNMRWMLSHFTQADVTNTTMLLYPGANVSRIRQRGGVMPSWGDSQRYSIDYSNEIWGSDIDFLVLQTKQVWIRSPWEGHRFVVRGNLGWIETNNFDKVPPDLRFFAGGDGSVRGYGYQKISPEDSKGKLTGASKLVVGSIEYDYNFTGNWWGAAFIDSGEAVNDIKKSDFKTGAGIGVRWVSPVGPIKFDLATPIGDPDNNKIQFYIGLGTEL